MSQGTLLKYEVLEDLGTQRQPACSGRSNLPCRTPGKKMKPVLGLKLHKEAGPTIGLGCLESHALSHHQYSGW